MLYSEVTLDKPPDNRFPMASAENTSGAASEMRGAGDFLAGGGELGERIRLHDWAATPLGALCDRLQSLRARSELCVRSQFRIITHWGSHRSVQRVIPLIDDKHTAVRIAA
jgi:hypothetical protein